MKRPSFQFYPGDWQSNQKLKRCTHEEKGVWMDVLALMHDSEEYGVLRWPLADIARAVGTPIEVLTSLWKKGVLKGKPSIPMPPIGETNGTANGNGIGGTNGLPLVYQPRHAGKLGEPVVLLPDQDGDIWFSSRMVEDEHLRQRRGEHGIKALSAPNASKKKEGKGSPIPTIGETIGTTNGNGIGAPPSSSSSSSSSSSVIKNSCAEECFAPSTQQGLGEGNFELELQTTEEPFIVLPALEGKEFEVFQPLIDELSSLYPSVDVQQEFRNMKGWILGNKKNMKTKGGIPRFYTAWLADKQNKLSWVGGKGGKTIGHKLTEGKWGGFEGKNYREGTKPDGSF